MFCFNPIFPHFLFSIQSVSACGDSYEGVALAAAMYHKEVQFLMR